MTRTTETFALFYGGDSLTVEYDGNMYVAPSCGAQYATRGDAMRQELYHYMIAGGDDLRADDGSLDHVDLSEYGTWQDDD